MTTITSLNRQALSPLSIPVTRALRKLGHDIRDARRRRRIPVAILAQRASISRTTLHKVEKGDAGVSLGTYATVLFSLGMIDRLSERIKRSFRTIEQIERVRAGELDIDVEGNVSLHSDSTIMSSEKLVKVDGEQIHLG